MTMQAIDRLKKEHQIILRALRSISGMCEKAKRTGALQRQDFTEALNFIFFYADEFHHKKEENVLFEWMVERGFPMQGGPIQIMLSEHDLGRALVGKARDALEQNGINEGERVAIVASALGEFTALLTQHIYKEDNILYPLAERLADMGSDDEICLRYQAQFVDSDFTAIDKYYETTITKWEIEYGG